jgi:hypothetical protein
MSGTLHLCQVKSNRGPRGRKYDFADGKRMIRRLAAQELILSFVPDPDLRLWRAVTRRKRRDPGSSLGWHAAAKRPPHPFVLS